MIHRLQGRPLLTLRPSLTPAPLQNESIAPTPLLAPPDAHEKPGDNSLREALLGPSLVAVALGSLVARPRKDNENQQNPLPLELIKQSLPQPAKQTAFLARASCEKKTARVGARVSLVLEIENVSGAPATLVFGSGQQCDFEAKSGDQTWKWSQTQGFSHGPGSQILGKGEILRWNCAWPTGEMRPGRFQIRGLCVGNGGIFAPEFEIELV